MRSLPAEQILMPREWTWWETAPGMLRPEARFNTGRARKMSPAIIVPANRSRWVLFLHLPDFSLGWDPAGQARWLRGGGPAPRP